MEFWLSFLPIIIYLLLIVVLVVLIILGIQSINAMKKVNKVVDDVNYVAWDIAITDKGPVVVEGNPYPGYYYQCPVHTPNKIGVVPVFEKILS